MKNLALLGASGSIGKQTIDVLRHLKDEYKLVAFSVGNNVQYANEILKEFKDVELLCVQNEKDIKKVDFSNVVCKDQGLIDVATYQKVDIVLTAVVGSVGLMPTIKAIEAKKDIALANKETLVMAGHIVIPLAKKKGIKILPVDSEHSAIFQCLNGENKKDIKNLIITASGGSFRDKTLEQLKGITKQEALNHPNWSMGAKITIDSATMINKGLEVIEAHHLFNIEYDNIKTIIHKESIIHSMVEFCDGAIIAQLGYPSMRVPISYALTYPKRYDIKETHLDFTKISNLNFQEIDLDRFEGLRLSYEAGKKGHSYPTVLNAANEIAVELFLSQKIDFLDITKIIKKELETHEVILNPSIEEVLEITFKIKNKIKREYS